MGQHISVGDWVNSYSKGIYRVERIVDRYFDESSPRVDGNKVGDKYENRTIVSKRLLNLKFKKSLGYEQCSDFFLSQLEQGQLFELKKVLTQNPSFIKELDDYNIPTLINIYNSELQIDEEHDLRTVLELIEFIRMY